MRYLVLSICAATLTFWAGETLAEKQPCHETVSATWYFGGGTSSETYQGVGATQAKAIESARSQCKSYQILDNRKSQCNSAPSLGKASKACADSPGCHKIDMKAIGWRGRGHKTKWCVKRGYQGHRREGKNYRTGNVCLLGQGC